MTFKDGTLVIYGDVNEALSDAGKTGLVTEVIIPKNWVDVIWSEDIKRSFDVAIRVDVVNGKGVLARIAGTLTSADANIAHVTMDDRLTEHAASMRFVVQVEGRYHLSKVMRRLRQNQDVIRISRVLGK